MVMRALAVVALLMSASHAALAQGKEIEVVGLFKGAAVLRVDGVQQLVRDGADHSGGITVIRADSREVLVEVDGTVQRLTLSGRVSDSYAKPERQTVSIARNPAGQYVTTGSVNGRPVTFLVDTGASVVALNETMAVALGISLDDAPRRNVVTAGGTVRSWQVTLDVVQVGDIRVDGVVAAVLPGNEPADVLLGMTFLANVEMREASGVLALINTL